MQRLLIFLPFLLTSLNAVAQSEKVQLIKIDANTVKGEQEALSGGSSMNYDTPQSPVILEDMVGALDNFSENAATAILKREAYAIVHGHWSDEVLAERGHGAEANDLCILYKMKDNIIRRALAFEPKKRWLIWT